MSNPQYGGIFGDESLSTSEIMPSLDEDMCALAADSELIFDLKIDDVDSRVAIAEMTFEYFGLERSENARRRRGKISEPDYCCIPRMSCTYCVAVSPVFCYS